jgi:hydroxymethylglutaryl-CoA reductase
LENVIGLAKVPVGVAGPLLIHGEDVNGYELLPMATTEGALIASATRGATALTRSGGVWAVSQQQKISRAPVFYLRTGREATVLLDWLESNQTRLQSQIEEYSQHAKLLRLEGQQCGKMLTVQFVYTTGDAAGQNMTTSVTWHACRWALEQIKKELPHIEVEDFVIEGNRTGDKKAAHSHFLQTRGIAAQAETWIPESVLKSVLKLDSQTLLKAYHTFIAGGITAGVVSANINVSNVIAAVFTATGQDIASTIESSASLFHMIPYKKRTQALSEDFTPAAQAAVLDVMDREGGVYAALSLPSILAGTVGGGTGLATQKECLEIMNCYGKGKSRRLAEIIAAYALALDVSTIAAVGSGHFASAHEKLGRNRPNTGLADNHLNHHFFSKVLGDRGVLEDWKAVKVDTRNSILSEMTSTDLRTKKVGHLGYVLNYKRSGDNTSAELPVVVKSKPLDSEVYNLVNKMAQGCGLELASLFQKWKSLTGYKNCHEREIQLAMSEEEKLKKYMLEVYQVLRDPEKEVYAFAMELLTKEKFRHMSTENDVSVWTESDLKVSGYRVFYSLEYSSYAANNGVTVMVLYIV